jgi:L-asparaginase II
VAHPEPLARLVRSGLEESVHFGDVAVCDADGRLQAMAGDPDRPLFARSSMKPLQAAVSLSAGVEEDLTDREVAVMCASHNGEPVHIESVAGLLQRGGLGFDALRCPPGWPLDPQEMARAGTARRELHNCSGKHAGKLLACVRSGWDTERYLDPDHPLQRRILEAVLNGTGLSEVHVGVDGCGAPVHGMPLSSMATLFARLASTDRWDALAPFVTRATSAMVAEPYLVAGRDRVDTALMEAAPGLFVKAGAEGLICTGVPEQGMGVAVKIADGSSRGAGPALISALRELDVLDDGQVERLASHARPPTLGGGLPVGELAPSFSLRRP